ncbi:MAG: proteasome ATPase [Acidimicrobiaceae bacterium]|jgi:proteasome-associated ATPase|nr:proteasome ATPase [Acidimicrobiaceae bacterium]|tara:strand:+ start:20 stop:1789 length:1770 start_codon:yes stop_codon:yes gene_type:complete
MADSNDASDQSFNPDVEKNVSDSLKDSEAMMEEVKELRKHRLENAQKINQLRKENRDILSSLEQEKARNEKLADTLESVRDQVLSLRDEIENLSKPPSAYGTIVKINDDGTVDVTSSGRKMRVNALPSKMESLKIGDEVILNESMVLVDSRDPESSGEIVRVKEVLDGGNRAVVVGRTDEERVVEMAIGLHDSGLRSGDSVRVDERSGILLERLPRPEVEDLVLEQIPNETYEDVGGLDREIEMIVDAVELPFMHKELFSLYELPAPKGILLYGPPGCGKTLIAKAVANSLALKVAEVTGDHAARSYFLNIKGPELLNKYVGETERQIRLVFQRAREKSEQGWPVIVFFDEMESLFRTRGTGISSDMESTIVPQLLAEIDGVETLQNVIVIGASNREDLIDPAILRPGRLDVKIKIKRPDEVAAAQIFSRYLTVDLPVDSELIDSLGGGDQDKALKAMTDEAVAAMYSTQEANQFLEVTYQNGEKEVLYFKDFASGAMIENIVRRAKKLAIKRDLAGGVKGLQVEDLLTAVRQEFREHEDLPNTTNPDDWAKISGKKGERIVYVRTLAPDTPEDSGGRSIEAVTTGQYL